jgi:hypothetical protein
MRKTMIVLVLMSVISTNSLFPAMFGNESCRAFPLQCDPDLGKSLAEITTIGNLIAQGGTYFLKSSSDMDLFLSLIESSELSGPDFDALQASVNSAIDNMKRARAAYFQLKNLAAVTPYNQEVISQLIEFDYDGYQKKNGLIPSVFDKVRNYLCAGDVRGVYADFYYNTGVILKLLTNIKKELDLGIFSSLSSYWRLNQKFSENKIFGQYIAEVFYSLK